MSLHSTIWGSLNRTSPKLTRYTSIQCVREKRRIAQKKRRASLPPKAYSLEETRSGSKRYLAMSRELWWPAYHRRYNRKTPDIR